MKKLKKTLAMILCLAMCLSMFPASAFAEEGAAEAPAEQIEEPVYEEPVYEEPVYEEPVYEEPVYEEPVYEEPVYEEPVNEEPVNEEPVNEEPVNEEPVNEEPVNEEPVNQEPVNQEPATAEPEMPAPVRVIFEVPAEGAAVRVYTKDESLNETDVAAEEDGSFLLLPGQYYYKISAEGYAETEETEFTVEASEETFTVAVEMTLSGTGSDADSAEAALTVAEILTGTGVSYYTPENDGTTNEELLTEYAAQQLEKAKRSGGGMLMAPGRPTSGLNAAQTEAYYILKGFITETAAGSRPLTQYAVNFDSDFISENLTWTPETLPGGGYESFTEENWQAAAEQGYEATMALGPLHTALLNTLPFELYWYDKTMGVMCTYSFSASKMSNGSIGSVSITSITYIFTVAEAYSDGQTYATDGSGNAIRNPNNNRAYPIRVKDVGSTINAAVANAQAVVSSNSGLGDAEKLAAYKDYICAQVSYNHAAAADDYDLGYGDPWQLIYAFDDDANTNIVCEGYSKAFEYLCDLSSFSSNVHAYCVTGTMDGGTGAGAHMWNIVSMDDGRNYLVDVTNCDEGSVGAPDQLFLKGCASGNADEGYIFSCNDGASQIAYLYDSNTRNYYDTDELTVSAYDYGDTSGDEPVGEPLPAPTNLTWGVDPDGNARPGMITFSPADEVSRSYQVKVYRTDASDPVAESRGYFSDDQVASGTLFSYSFLADADLTQSGSYYFTVQALALRDEGYSDSAVVQSDTWDYTASAVKLGTPTNVSLGSDMKVSLTMPEDLSNCGGMYMRLYYAANSSAEPQLLNYSYSFSRTETSNLISEINSQIRGCIYSDYGMIQRESKSGYYAVEIRLNSSDVTVAQHGDFSARSAPTYIEVVDNHLSVSAVGDTEKHVAIGSQVTMQVTATADDPSGITYEWSKYDEETNGYIRNLGDTDSLTVTAEKTEAYYVWVSDGYGNSQSVTFVIYVDGELSDNTSFETAIELTEDQLFDVTGSAEGVTRYYKFTPAESSYYGLKMNEDSVLWVQMVDVFGADRSYVGSGDQYGGPYVYQLPYLTAGETYYIVIQIGNEGTASFELCWDNHLRAYPADDAWETLVPYGESAVLRVTAEGADLSNLSYEWRDGEGNTIAGETADTLTTAAITGRTTYYCVVTDQYGNTASAHFEVGIDNALTATAADGITELKLPMGAAFTLSVNVTALNPEGMTYRWTKWGDGVEYTELTETGTSLTDTVSGRLYYQFMVQDQYENHNYVMFQISVDNQLQAWVEGTDGSGSQNFYLKPGETATMKAAVSAAQSENMSYRWNWEVYYTNGHVETDSMSGSLQMTSIQMPEAVDYVHYTFQVQDTYHNYASVHYWLKPFTYSCGVNGDNVTWSFDESTGVLTFSGTGDMAGSVGAWEMYKDRITAVVFTDGVTGVGAETFSSFTGITSVSLPEGVRSIAYSGFEGCTGLTEVTLPDSLEEIGSAAFAGSGLTGITIPDNVRTIAYSSFEGCTDLTAVTLPDSLEEIGSSAFAGSGLTGITIPDNVRTIEYSSFEGCSSLSAVNLPANLEEIGERAFADNTSLTEITIPVTTARILPYAFSGCVNLQTVNYPGTQEQWDAIEIGEGNAPLLNAQLILGGQTDPTTDALPAPTNLIWNQGWHGHTENGMAHFEYESETKLDAVVSFYRVGEEQAIYEGDQWVTMVEQTEGSGKWLCHSAWFKFNSRELENGSYFFTVKLVAGDEESVAVRSESWTYTAPSVSVPSPEVNGIVYTAEKELVPDFTLVGSDYAQGPQFTVEYRPDVNSEEGSRQEKFSYRPDLDPVDEAKKSMNETMQSDGFGEGWYRIGVMVNSSDITAAKNSETVYSEWQFISAGQIAGTEELSDSLPTPTNLKWNQAWHGQPENGMMYFEYEGDTAYGVVVSLYRDGVAQAIYEGDQWATVNTRADRPGVMLCHSAWFRFNSRDLESGTYYFMVKLVSDGGEESELATSPSWIYTAPNASVPAPEVNGIVYTAEKELAPDFTVTGSEEYPNIQFALEYRPDVNSEEGSKKVERSYGGQYNPISNSKPFMNETMRSDGFGEGWYRIGVMVNSSDITAAKNSETVYSEWQFISAGQIAGTEETEDANSIEVLSVDKQANGSVRAQVRLSTTEELTATGFVYGVEVSTTEDFSAERWWTQTVEGSQQYDDEILAVDLYHDWIPGLTYYARGILEEGTWNGQMLNTVCRGSQVVPFTTPVTDDDFTAISVDGTAEVRRYQENRIRFTAQNDGEYSISGSTTAVNYISVYGADGEELNSAWESGGSGEVSVPFSAAAGETVYIYVNAYYGDGTVTLTEHKSATENSIEVLRAAIDAQGQLTVDFRISTVPELADMGFDYGFEISNREDFEQDGAYQSPYYGHSSERYNNSDISENFVPETLVPGVTYYIRGFLRESEFNEQLGYYEQGDVVCRGTQTVSFVAAGSDTDFTPISAGAAPMNAAANGYKFLFAPSAGGMYAASGSSSMQYIEVYRDNGDRVAYAYQDAPSAEIDVIFDTQSGEKFYIFAYGYDDSATISLVDAKEKAADLPLGQATAVDNGSIVRFTAAENGYYKFAYNVSSTPYRIEIQDQSSGNWNSFYSGYSFWLPAGESVYLRPNYDQGHGQMALIVTKFTAPDADSISVSAPSNVTNYGATYVFTYSVTEATAAHGYGIGIATAMDPDFYEPTGRQIFVSQNQVTNNDTLIYTYNAYTPGETVWYKAVLIDTSDGSVVAEGSEVYQLTVQSGLNGYTELKKGTQVTYSAAATGVGNFYYTATADEVIAVQANDVYNLTYKIPDGNGESKSTRYPQDRLLGVWVEEGQTVYFHTFHNKDGAQRNILLTDGLDVLPALNEGGSVTVSPDTVKLFSYTAEHSGLHRFALDRDEYRIWFVGKDNTLHPAENPFSERLDEGDTIWIRVFPNYGSAPQATLSAEWISSDALVSELKAAISDPDRNSYSLSNLGSVTLNENLTIPAGFYVDYNGTELIIPSGVTLEVQGSLQGSALTVSGEVIVNGSDGDNVLAAREHIAFDPAGGGMLRVRNPYAFVELDGGNNSRNYSNYFSGIVPHLDLADGASVIFGYSVGSESDINSVLSDLYNHGILNDGRFRQDLQLQTSVTLSGDLYLPANASLHTDCVWNSDTLTVAEGASLTLENGSWLYAFSSDTVVEGSLYNDGEIILGVQVDTGTVSSLILSGGSYEGNGEIRVQTAENPMNYLQGFNPDELVVVRSSGSETVYRVAGEAAEETSVELVRLETDEYGNVTATLRVSTTAEFADNWYTYGVRTSNRPDFAWTENGYDHINVDDALNTRYNGEEVDCYVWTGEMIPGVTYYLKAVLQNGSYNEAAGAFEYMTIAAESETVLSITAPGSEADFTPIELGDSAAVRKYETSKFLFTAPANGLYALKGSANSLSAFRTDGGEAGRSAWMDGQNLTNSVVFYAAAGEKVYLFANANDGDGTVQLLNADQAMNALPLNTETPVDSGVTVRYTAAAAGHYKIAYSPANNQYSLQLMDAETGSWTYYSGGFTVKLAAGESAYLRPNYNQSQGRLSVKVTRVNPPTADSVSVAAARNVTNCSAEFPFTYSITEATAANGYAVGIETAKDKDFTQMNGMMTWTSSNSVANNESLSVTFDHLYPGQSFWYRAILLDPQNGNILKRGSAVYQVNVQNNLNGYTQLTKDSAAEFNTMGVSRFWYVAENSGMLAIRATGASSVSYTLENGQSNGLGGNGGTLLLGCWAEAGQKVYINVHYYNQGGTCTVEVKDALGVLPAVDEGEVPVIRFTTASYTAQNTGLHRFAVDNAVYNIDFMRNDGVWNYSGNPCSLEMTAGETVWLRATGGATGAGAGTLTGEYVDPNVILEKLKTAIANGESYFDLRGLISFTLTESLTIPENMHVDFWGTQLQVPAGVKLTVLGSMRGESTEIGGTVEVRGGDLYQKGILFTNDDAVLDLNSRGGASMPVDSWTSDVEAHVSFGEECYLNLNDEANSAAELNAAKRRITEPKAHVIHWININFPWTVSIPETIPQNAVYEFADNCMLLVEQDVTLNVLGGLKLRGTAAEIGGKINNEGWIEVAANDDGTMGMVHLMDSGSYTGAGELRVMTATEPLSWLRGFDHDSLQEKWSDANGVCYVYTMGVFDALEAACKSGADWYGLDDIAALSIARDLTIPANMHLDAWNAVITVPEGVTLTVNGAVGMKGVMVEDGGTLRFGDGAHGTITESIECGDTAVLELGREVNLDISVSAWNQRSIQAEIGFADESARIWLYGEVRSDEELENALGELSAVTPPAGQEDHFGKIINLYYRWMPANGFIMDADIDWHIINNGDDLGAIAVEPGSTLMMNTYLCLHGAAMEVNGKLYNNGMIDLQTENGTGAVLSLGPDGEYAGDGFVQIGNGDQESGLFGFTDYTLSTVWEDQQSTAYRIVEGVAEEYGYGSKFYVNTTMPVLFTVEESGIYMMTVSVPEGSWGEISLSNSPIDHWSLTEGDNEIPVLLEQGVAYELSFMSDSASEAEIRLSAEPRDGIISKEAHDITATSAQIEVGLSVTEATAAAGDYVWGIKYSTDDEFREENSYIWGWNVESGAQALNFRNHDLCTLIPGTDYAYKAVLCRISEDGDFGEVIAEEGLAHYFRTAEAEGEFPSLREGVAEQVTQNTHQTFTFDAAEKVYYAVSGKNLDYICIKDLSGRIIPFFHIPSDVSGDGRGYAFFAVSEVQTVYIATGSHGAVQGDIMVAEAAKTAAALSYSPFTLKENSQAVKFTAPLSGWYDIAVTGSEAFLAMVDFESGTWYSPGTACNVYLTKGEIWFGIAGGAGATLKVTRAGSDLAENLAYLGTQDIGYDFNLNDVTVITDAVTVPRNVRLNINADVTVQDGGTLINYGDIAVKDEGCLWLGTYNENQFGEPELDPHNGGKLIMIDGSDDWYATVSLEGGSVDVSGGEVTYGDRSMMVIKDDYYDSLSMAMEHLRGISSEDKKHVEFDIPVYADYELYQYDELSDYGRVKILMMDGLEQNLDVSLPKSFCLVVNEGCSVIVGSMPGNTETNVYGDFILEGGSLINETALNLYGQVIYQNSSSLFENNGTLNVTGWIGVNSWHEGNTTGTLYNNGTISLVGGVIEPEITVIGSEPQTIVSIAIDEKNFPDDSFRNYVGSTIDSNGDGQLSDEEIGAVTEIRVDGMAIGSLRGIELFTGLQVLSASGNNLTELDLSANTALTDLDVSNNQLTALNLSSNTALTTLNVGGNQLTELDLSANTELTDLDVSSNRLTSLNLSNCPNLSTLNATGNSLTRLDLRSCPNIVEVSYDETVHRITKATEIEITEANFPDAVFRDFIKGFNTDGSTTDVEEYGLYGDSIIRSVETLDSNEIAAVEEGIDVSGRDIASLQGIELFTGLRSLKAANNNLTGLDLSGNADLVILDVSGNRLTTLNISGCPALLDVVQKGTMLSQDGITRNWFETADGKRELKRDTSARLITGKGVEISMSNFPDANFRAYVAKHFDLNGTGTLDADEIANVTGISLWDENYEPVPVSNLQGIEFFPALTSLWVENNNITSLDLRANQRLENLTCKYNLNLTSVDLSQNTALRTLFIEDNKLSKLDVSANVNLESLHCGNNPLTVLDLSHNPALTNLEVYGTKLSKLDVSKNEHLSTILAFDTPLTSFTPSTGLRILSLNNARLTSLDVSGCPNLIDLSVKQNRLTSLSLNSSLAALDCSGNQLSNLDLGANENLYVLRCSGNRLKTLDISGCSSLKAAIADSGRRVSLSSGVVSISVNADGNETLVMQYDNTMKLNLGEEELSGFCGASGNGSNLTWTLEPSGTLNISGSGAMKNFASAEETPWALNAGSITNVLIGNAVTTIGSYAFAGCENLHDVFLTGNKPTIAANAFENLGANFAEGTRIHFPGRLNYQGIMMMDTAYGAAKISWTPDDSFKVLLDPNGGAFEELDKTLAWDEENESYEEWQERAWAWSSANNYWRYDSGFVTRSKIFNEYGVIIPMSVQPTREGYVFQGWSQTATGGVRYKAGDAFTENVDRTLYAVWKANTYQINFNSNLDAINENRELNGEETVTITGTMRAQDMNFGKAQTLTQNAYRYADNSFVGWALTPKRALDGMMDFVNRENVTDEILIQKVRECTESPMEGEESFDFYNGGADLFKGGEITLYAVWKPTALSVTLYSGYEIADDNSLIPASVPVPIIEGSTLTVDMYEMPTIELQAEVNPYDGNLATSAEQSVKWTTSSAAIATVDENGVVSFLKTGTVTITATTTDGSNKRATVKFSIYYIDPGNRLTASLAETSTTYAVATAIGLQKGDKAQLNIYGTDTTTPLPQDLFQYDITTMDGKKYLEFESNGQVTAKQRDDNTDKSVSIKATLLNDPLKRTVTVNIKTIAPQTKEIDMTNANVTLEDGAIYLEKKTTAQTITITPIVKDAAGQEILLERGLLTYASTNRAAAAPTETSSGAVTVTIPANATGAATITATSKDYAKTVGSLSIYVMDYEPRTDVKSVTIDTHMGTTAEIPLVVSNGNEITKVVFKEYIAASRSYEPSVRIEAELNTEDDPTTAIVTLRANTGIANSTIRGQLAVYTDRNPQSSDPEEDKPYTYDLNVVSKSTLPSISIRQTSLNTFYKDSESTVTVTVRNTQVEWVELNAGTIFKSGESYTDGENTVLTIRFDDTQDIFPDNGTTNAFNPTAEQKNGMLSIKLQGYVNPVQQPISIQTNNVRPALKLSAASTSLNTALDGDTVTVTLLDSKTNLPYPIEISSDVVNDPDQKQLYVTDKPKLATVRLATDSNPCADLDITLNDNGKEKGGRVTMSVQDDNWTQAVTYPFNVTVNTQLPRLTLAQTTLTLNKRFPGDKGIIAATEVRSNQAGTDLSAIEFSDLTENDVKPAEGKDLIAVDYDGNSKEIRATLIGNPKANSTYTFTFHPTYKGTPLPDVSVRVTVNDQQPTATLTPNSVSLSAFSIGGEQQTVIKLNNDLVSVDDVEATLTTRNVPDLFDIECVGDNNLIVSYKPGVEIYTENNTTVIRYNGTEIPARATSYTYQLTPKLSEGVNQTARPVNLTIRTIDDRPTLRAAKTSFTLNSAFGTADSTAISLVNVPGQTIIALDWAANNTAAATLTGFDKLSFEESFEDGGVSGLTIRIAETDKENYSVPVRLVALVQRDDGVIESKPLVINVRAVNTTPNVTLASPTLTINRKLAVPAISTIKVPEGYDFVGFTEMEETGVYGDGYAILTLSNGRLQARLTQSAIDANRNGSYPFNLTPIVMDINTGITAECRTVRATVSNTSSDTWRINVAPSGKLDTVQRFSDEGKMIYTITGMNGIQGIPTSASLVNEGDGRYASLFNVSGVQINDRGQAYVVLSLKDGVDYPTNVNYNKLKLRFTFADGTGEGIQVDSQELSLRVTQTALRLTAKESKQTVYQSQAKTRTVTYEIELTSPNEATMNDLNVTVGDIRQWQSALENPDEDIFFELKKNSYGRTLLVHVTLKDLAQLAAGQNYTLPILVKAEGAASNMAATTVNLSLAVQK